MPIYSHSQLSTFEQCPLRYKLRYIDRVERPDAPSAEALTGLLVHEVLQKLYDGLKYEKLASLDELLRYYDGRWRETWTPKVQIVRDGLTAENYRDYGVRCIRSYYQRHAPFTQSRTLATELRLLFALDPEGKYKFQGYIDRLARASDGTYEIHDYKTSGTLPDQAHADRDRQLPLYQIGLESRWNDVERVELVWHYVGFDSILSSRRSPDQLQELRQKTIELICQIESASDFPPVKSALCDWCEYRAQCPLWKHVLAVGAMPVQQAVQDEGWQLASEYAELKRKADEIERKIADLRDRIIAYAAGRRLKVVQGKNSQVWIAERQQVALPPRDDPGREELESTIREIGQWHALSDLSPSRIAAALQNPSWPKPWKARVTALLRTTRAFTVRLRRTGERHEDVD